MTSRPAHVSEPRGAARPESALEKPSTVEPAAPPRAPAGVETEASGDPEGEGACCPLPARGQDERDTFITHVTTADGIEVEATVVARIERDETPGKPLRAWAEIESVQAVSHNYVAWCSGKRKHVCDRRGCGTRHVSRGDEILSQLSRSERDRLVNEAEARVR